MLQHRPSEENVPAAVRLSPESTESQTTVPESPVSDTLDSLLWDNPMLAKELRRSRREDWTDARSLLRQRLRASLIQGAIVSAAGLGLLETQIIPRLSGNEPSLVWLGSFIAIAVIQTAMAALGAGTVGARIQGERMKQTWSAVLLTRLSPAQVVLGKIGASVAPGLFSALALVPASLWCLFRAGEPTAFLSALALWPTILVSAALTGLLSVRVALRGKPRGKWGGFLGMAGGGYWMGAPILGQILGTFGALLGGVLSHLGFDIGPLYPVALILFALAMVPLTVVNPLAALFAALPWSWPDPNWAPWATAIRVALVLIHLGFAVHWTRKNWKAALQDVARSQPDLTP